MCLSLSSTLCSPLTVRTQVVPYFKSSALSWEGNDVVATIPIVEVNRHPVFFINPSASLRYNSKREEPDMHKRRRFRDLRQSLIFAPSTALALFSTRLSFYEYEPVTHVLQPGHTSSKPTLLSDVIAGTMTLCNRKGRIGIAEKVKETCSQLLS